MTTGSETLHRGGPSVAVVGAGAWGKNLVRNFHEFGVLRLVCEPDRSRREAIKRAFPDVQIGESIEDAAKAPGIDCVVIATPAETHFEVAQAALAAGKHVFVEKPLTLDEGQAQTLIDLADQGGRVLMVGHLLQYHPAFLALKKLVKAGKLGRINYIYSNRLNLGKIRREENILWSFAPHDISMILELAGEAPDKVLTTGGFFLHQNIADVTTTHMDFPSGLRAHIFVSWLHPFKEQKLVVVGEEMMAVFDDTLPWPDKLLLYPHVIRWENHMPMAVKAEPERPEIEQNEPLRMECEHFLTCVRDGRQPRTDGREGLRVLRVLKASQASLEDSGVPKSLEDMPGAPCSQKDYFVHPTAVVDDEVEVGQGVKIWHFSHVLKNSRLGSGCNIGQNVVVGPDVSIGSGCKIQNNVSVYAGVTLEDDVFCGPSMVFTNIHNPRAHIARMHEMRRTLVRHGATLGANCTIVCGNTIGRHAFVGAGAVVTKDVSDHALVVGNPARRIGWMCSCGEKLGSDLGCAACKAQYRETDAGLEQLASQ